MSFAFLFLPLALAASAVAGELPKECRNVASYARTLGEMGVGNEHLKNCREEVASIFETWNAMGAANKKAVRHAQVSGGDSQVAALVDAGALAGAGSETEGGWAKNAAVSQAQFRSVADRVGSQIKRLDAETSRVLSLEQVGEGVKARFRKESALARADLVSLRSSAQSLSDEAGRYATRFRSGAAGLDVVRDRNDATARRLAGGVPADSTPAPKKGGVSTGLLVGLGGAALITAGAVGGLYWVSQKAIKTANDDAAQRILQAQIAANGVIANAEAAAQRILQFAVSSVSQIISNVAEAAHKIYERAKTDLAGLISQLRAEISSTFQNLTDAGLAKMQSELQALFGGLIARAKAEGNNALASSLQGALDTLNADIQNELNRRHGGSSTGTSISSSTGTGTSTATDTSTSTALGTSTVTVSAIDTMTAIGTRQ